MTREFGARVAYLLVCSLMILSAYFFADTKGLIYAFDVRGAPLYANDLMSSGSDDDTAVILAGLLFIIPLMTCIFRMPKELGPVDAVLLAVLLVLQFYVLLVLEAGSIVLTIESGNVPLFSYLVASFGLWFVLIINILIVIKRGK